MSRQFRFYLLPDEVEAFTNKLRDQVEINMFQNTAATPEPVAASTPLRRWSRLNGADVVGVYCLLAPVAATIKVNYYPTRSEWLVDEEKSEVIQFCGCDFDGETLHIGRFYTQADMLIGGTIWPKQKAFLQWVDRVYRAAKKLLKYSKELEAYLGPAAEQWRRQGGKFSEM
jgi:hypothetical protein